MLLTKKTTVACRFCVCSKRNVKHYFLSTISGENRKGKLSRMDASLKPALLIETCLMNYA